MTYDELQEGYIRCFHHLQIPDRVIALSRGGLFGGVLASHYFKKPMMVLDFSSDRGNGSTAGSDLSSLDSLPSGSKVLIVDDVCDTGSTLSEINYYLGSRVDHQTVVAHLKAESKFLPTQAIYNKVPTHHWVVYPWELVDGH